MKEERLKGGIKMKYAIIIAAILVLSIFSFGAVLAKENNSKSSELRMERQDKMAKEIREQKLEEVKEKLEDRNLNPLRIRSINSGELDSLEINSSRLEEYLNQKSDLKKAGFSKVWRGVGQINNDESGYLVSTIWVKQGLIETEENSSEIENYTKTRSFGFIRISDFGVYNLVRDTTDSNASEDSLRFYILPTSSKQLEPNASKKESIGTLILNQDKEYPNLVIWTGTLAFESGDLKGSWDINLYTDNHIIRSLPEEASSGQGKKIGFFNRLRFWKANN